MRQAFLIASLLLLGIGQASGASAIPLPAGPIKRMLHLGSAPTHHINGSPASAQNIHWDHLLTAGWGAEEMQRPAPGVAVDIGLSAGERPLVWSDISDPDGVWCDDGADGFVDYSALYVIAPHHRPCVIAWTAESANNDPWPSLRVWVDGVLRISGSGSGSSPSFLLNAGTHIVIIKHFNWTGSNGFTVAMQDDAGGDQSDLQFALVDESEPTVIAHIPAATSVARSVFQDVLIDFSEPMDASIAAASVASVDGGAIGAWSWIDRTRLAWAPSVPLRSDHLYTVTISAATALDAGGTAMASDLVFTFRTAPVASAPAVSAPHAGDLAREMRPQETAFFAYGGGFIADDVPHAAGFERRSINVTNAYRLMHPRTDWDSARDACRALGGHLPVIGDADEDAYVGALGGRSNAWLGVVTDPVSGVDQWVDGSTLTYTGWAPGEPNNFLGDLEDKSCYWYGLGWNDVDSVPASMRPYVCEIELPRGPRVVVNGQGRTHIARHVRLDDAGTLLVSVDLTGFPHGWYDVTVVNRDGGTATRTNAIAVNHRPVSDGNMTFALVPGQSVSGVLSATDMDGDAITYSAVHAPLHGRLTFDPTTAAFTYVADTSPYDDFEQIFIQAADPYGAIAVSVADITITGIGPPPPDGGSANDGAGTVVVTSSAPTGPGTTTCGPGAAILAVGAALAFLFAARRG